MLSRSVGTPPVTASQDTERNTGHSRTEGVRWRVGTQLEVLVKAALVGRLILDAVFVVSRIQRGFKS